MNSDTLFNLQFTGKQIERFSKKSEKEYHKELGKIKQALLRGDKETARVYSENSIRLKNESLNYLRLSSRVSSVVSRLKSAESLKQTMNTLGMSTKELEKVMKSMDLVKIGKIMDNFTNQFDNLDVMTSTISTTMDSAMATSTPQDQVTELMIKVAEENDLDVLGQLKDIDSGRQNELTKEESDTLESRLAKLRD